MRARWDGPVGATGDVERQRRLGHRGSTRGGSRESDAARRRRQGAAQLPDPVQAKGLTMPVIAVRYALRSASEHGKLCACATAGESGTVFSKDPRLQHVISIG
ncbi:protein of unknown function [Pararobbsia alpina]